MSSRGSGRPTMLPGWLGRFGRAVSQGFLFKGSYVIGSVAGFGVIVLGLVTLVTVISRHSPIAGPWLRYGFEVSELSMGLVSVLAISYCWYVGGHIRITLLRERARPRNKTILDVISAFLVFVWVIAIVWGMWRMAIESLAFGVSTNNLGIPVAPFQIVFAIVMAHFVLVALRSLLGFTAKATGRHVEHDGLY